MQRLPSLSADYSLEPPAEGWLSQAERLRLAEEAAGIAHWEYDVARDRSWLSANFAALYGLPADFGATMDMPSFLALVHPDDRDRLEQATQAAVRTGLLDEEYRIRLPGTGEERWLRTLGRCHHRPQGPLLVGINQDVTERHQMQAVLAQQEARLRLVQQATGVGVWFWDAVADRQTWCEEQYRLHGLDPSEPAPSFVEWLSWVHPEDRPALRRATREGFDGPHGAYRLIIRLRRPKTGEWRWLLSYGRATRRAADGAITHIEGLNIDLTDDAALTARYTGSPATPELISVPPGPSRIAPASPSGLRALADSEAHLRLVQEVAGAGIWVWPAFTPRGFWSDQQYRLHDMDPSLPAPTAEEWFGWVHPEDRAAVIAATESGFRAADGRYQVVCRVRSPAASDWRWLLCFGSVRRNGAGQAIGVEGVTLDVTREHHLRAELRQRETLLRAIADTVPNPIFVKDTEGRLLLANPATLRVIGHTAEAVLGRNEAEWHHDPAEAAAIMANDRQVLTTGQAVDVEEVFATPGGGPARIWRASKTPMRDADGNVVGLVGISTDVTDLRRTEAALRAAVDMRETLVREADHRIKNSLQLVASLLQMQARRTSQEAGAALSAAAARVIAIGHAHRSLYSSRDLTSVDVASLLHDLAMHAQDLAGPRIHIVCAPGPTLALDAERGIPLGLVVSEVLTNAVRHAFPDGRTGTIHLTAATLPGNVLEIRIADDGVGQTGETSASPRGATAKAGMGGSIVRSLAAQIGAQVLSAQDGGTHVTVRLPLAPTAAAA